MILPIVAALKIVCGAPWPEAWRIKRYFLGLMSVCLAKNEEQTDHCLVTLRKQLANS